MAFIELSVVNLGYAEMEFAKFVEAMPLMLITTQKLVGQSMMDVLVMPAIRSQTPIASGALLAQTDWRTASSSPTETKIEVFSTAQNVRSGYEYARARAYGFMKVGGKERWIPPESPPYPRAGFDQADVSRIGAATALGNIMRIVPL